MIHIKFSEFCKNIYPSCPSITNQGIFVTKLFTAAGSSFFPSSNYGSVDYQRKLFNGSKSLTRNLIASFPEPITMDKLFCFFKDNVSSKNVEKLMVSFGIPDTEKQDMALLAAALSKQFQLIITSVDSDVENIVCAEYQRLLRNPEQKNDKPALPLYPGDGSWLMDTIFKRKYIVGFYEKFIHTWVIRNNGNVAWEGRRLECKNYDKVKVRPERIYLDIPYTLPGQETKLIVQFDARGSEGTFESIWQIKDSEGRDCFPNESKMFSVIITVENKLHI